MNKFTVTILSLFLAASALAQSTLSTGFYRVKNDVTNNYISLIHDSCGPSKTNPDLGSIQLYSSADRNLVSDPGAVIYVKHLSGEQYDLVAQGTSVVNFTGMSVTIRGNAEDGYQVSAVHSSGMKATLYDGTMKYYDHSLVSTSGVDAYSWWMPSAVSSADDNTFFGITPTLNVGDNHYKPFYASFAFKPASANMKVYYINKIDGSVAVMKEIEGIVPPATPVIIECVSSNPSDNRLDLFYDGGTKITDNLLRGNYFCNDFREALVAFNKSKMRVLNVSDGKLVFSEDTEKLHVLNDFLRADYSKKLKQMDEDIDDYGEDMVDMNKYNRYKYLIECSFLNCNEAYLPYTGTESALRLVTEAEYVGIENVFSSSTATPSKYYTIDGHVTDALSKGINIVKMSDGTVKKLLK